MLANAAYLALGLAWTFRSALEVVAHPDYWSPRTPTDHLAIWSYSLALALVAPGVVILARGARDGAATTLASATAVLAAITSLANVVEDAFGLRGFGMVYVFGILGMVVGLLGLAIRLGRVRGSRAGVVALLWSVGAVLLTTGFGVVVLIGSIVAITERRPS